jgi:hypothetical protein
MTPTQQKLVNLITDNSLTATADAADFASITTFAHNKTIPVENHTSYSLALIGDKLSETLGATDGLAARRLFADTLDAAIASKEAAREANDTVNAAGLGELRLAQDALGNGKLQLFQADRQATINELGAGWPASDLAAILALGITYISPAEQAGIAADTTALDFEVAWIVKTGLDTSQVTLDAANATFQTDTAAAKATFNSLTQAANDAFVPVSQKHNNIVQNLNAFEGVTAADWQAKVDALLASPDGN